MPRHEYGDEYASEPVDGGVPVTQLEKLKAHLMGLDALAPLDPKAIAETLEMEEKYVARLFGRLENAMIEWKDGKRVRMEDAFDPDSPGEVLRSVSGGKGDPEAGGLQMHSRHRRTSP